MFCTKCGGTLEANMPNCPNCGAGLQDTAALPQVQQASFQQPAYQPPQGQPFYYQQPNYQPPQDVPSSGLKFLAFFIPVAGLILYLIWKDQKPLTAQSLYKPMIAGFIVMVGLPILISIVSTIISLIFTGAMLGAAKEAADEYGYYYYIGNLIGTFRHLV